MKALREAVTAKQWRILELWAASYHKLGTDASAAPNLDAESRRFKVMVADALSAMLSAHETALRELAVIGDAMRSQDNACTADPIFVPVPGSAEFMLALVKSQWFLQGGESQFGSVRDAVDADDLIASILRLVRERLSAEGTAETPAPVLTRAEAEARLTDATMERLYAQAHNGYTGVYPVLRAVVLDALFPPSPAGEPT